MTNLARDLEKKAGIPVLDGVACAVGLAETLARLGLKTSKHNTYASPLTEVYAGEFLTGPGNRSEAARFALQGYDAVFRIHGGSSGTHIAMEQKRGLYLHGDPGVGMFCGLFAANHQLIVHAFDAGQTRHGVFCQDLCILRPPFRSG